jgi:hypothetical protein
VKNLHKKSTTKKGKASRQLTEEQVREIAREEIIKYERERKRREDSIPHVC